MAICRVQILPESQSSGQVPGTSASPGFTFGRAGNVTAGQYLQGPSGVLTNEAGVMATFDGVVTSAWVIAKAAATFDIDILRRVGVVFTTIGTISVVATRKGSAALAIPVSDQDELAVRVSAGSADEVSMGLIVEQT